ncbi:MAG TPA: hypothetical protein VHA11_09985 [Bryobacteraceae bacterium]|nr:hypothetical protein [Bryobacteraceae bacterium]
MRRLVVSLLVLAAVCPAADHELLKLVMPDARVVSGLHVTQMKKTPFGQFLLAQFSAAQDPEFDGFVKASGFDPRYHLDEIVIASPAQAEQERRLIAVRGTFDPARIFAIARSAGATVDNYGGIDILSNAGATGPNTKPLALAFLSGSVAVAGDPESVRGAVDRRSAGSGPNRDMVTRIDTVSAASDAWFVSNVPVAELAQGLPDSNLSGALRGDALRSIEQASGGATFGTAVKFSAELLTRTAEDASSLAGVLRFLSGLVRTGPQQSLVSALDLTAEGKTVKVNAAIPESLLETLFQQAGK